MRGSGVAALPRESRLTDRDNEISNYKERDRRERKELEMFLHGAAHLFFENKCAEIEAHFEAKFKHMEQHFEKELAVFGHELKKVKHDVKTLREDVCMIRNEEEDISVIGMNQINRLDKEVKHEVHDIKKIKTEVKHLKAEVKNIEELEDALENQGRTQIKKLGEMFEKEVAELKNEIVTLRSDVETSKKRGNMETNIKVDTKEISAEKDKKETRSLFKVKEVLQAADSFDIKRWQEESNIHPVVFLGETENLRRTHSAVILLIKDEDSTEDESEGTSVVCVGKVDNYLEENVNKSTKNVESEYAGQQDDSLIDSTKEAVKDWVG